MQVQAYWPFHRLSCHRNEFADAVEAAEPKFASWMRGHGKLAVLKDDEVDRLERAGAATMGASRTEVLESMYNRLVPKPQGTTRAYFSLARQPIPLTMSPLLFIKEADMFDTFVGNSHT